MTYFASFPTKTKKPKLAMLRINCADNPLTTNSLCTFDQPSGFGFNNIPAINFSYSGDTLTLGKGHWQLQGFVAIENDDDRRNNSHFQFVNSGTSSYIGTRGCSEISYSSSLDDCASTVSVDTGTVSVKLGFPIVNHYSGDLKVNNNYAHLIVYYCPLG